MKTDRDPLEAAFDALRSERIPPTIEREIELRLLGRRSFARPRGRRALFTAAALVLLAGLVGAAIVHWWRVRIDTHADTVEGGQLKEVLRGADGSVEYEIELSDGRRVRVQAPPASGEQRHVDVELKDPHAAEETAPRRKP